MGDEGGDESDDKTDAFSLQQRNTAYNAPVRVGLGFLTASQPDAAKGLAVERQSSLFRFPGKNARYLLLPYVPYDCNTLKLMNPLFFQSTFRVRRRVLPTPDGSWFPKPLLFRSTAPFAQN